MKKIILGLLFLFASQAAASVETVFVQNSTNAPVNVNLVSGSAGSSVVNVATVTFNNISQPVNATIVTPSTVTFNGVAQPILQGGDFSVNPGTGAYPVTQAGPFSVTATISGTPSIQVFTIGGTAGSGTQVSVNEGASDSGTQRVVLAAISGSSQNVVGTVLISTRTTVSSYITNLSSAAVFTQNARMDSLQEQLWLNSQTNNILTMLATERENSQQAGFEIR